MPDDIAHWRHERTKLQEQLDELQAGIADTNGLQWIRYLKTRIADIERHIAKLEKRRT
jgi:hypothetical protein